MLSIPESLISSSEESSGSAAKMTLLMDTVTANPLAGNQISICF